MQHTHHKDFGIRNSEFGLFTHKWQAGRLPHKGSG